MLTADLIGRELVRVLGECAMQNRTRALRPRSLRAVREGKMVRIFGLLATLVTLSASAVFAGPAEDANATIDRWAPTFSANDAEAIVKLYAPEATLLSTISPSIAATPE